MCTGGGSYSDPGGYYPIPINQPHNGGGGGGSNTNAGNMISGMKVDVDPNARECLKNIKATLESLGMKNTSKSAGLISNILNKLNLSTGFDFNAIITEGKTERSVAETTWQSDINGQRYTQIMFNEKYLNQSTDLKVVATLMHEYIHSYFDWNLYLMKSGSTNYDADFEKKYMLLFDKSGNQLNDGFGTAQHEQIATSFIHEIADMLKKYATEKGISTPVDSLYFNKMAWGGLMGTSLFKSAPEGTTYTNSAEEGTASSSITAVLNCKKY